MADRDHVAEARAVYDASADLYVERVGTELGPATEGAVDRALLAAFVELVGPNSGARVADVGCGPGRVAAFLARSGLDVIGLDVSSSMVTAAQDAHPEISFQVGQLDSLPLDDASLAGAVCWYSIIHTPPGSLDAAFGELARVLSPGGVLLLAFQAEDAPIHRPDAFGTGLPMTSYRHEVADVAARLAGSGFGVRSTTVREPEPGSAFESTPQAFVFGRRFER